jgi:hypothetical protein
LGSSAGTDAAGIAAAAARVRATTRLSRREGLLTVAASAVGPWCARCNKALTASAISASVAVNGHQFLVLALMW